MKRLLYVLAGLVVGVVVSANSRNLPPAAKGAALLFLALSVAVGWFAGQRDRRESVAVAVAAVRAELVAEAAATADAHAEQVAAVQARTTVTVTQAAGSVGTGPADVDGALVAAVLAALEQREFVDGHAPLDRRGGAQLLEAGELPRVPARGDMGDRTAPGRW